MRPFVPKLQTVLIATAVVISGIFSALGAAEHDAGSLLEGGQNAATAQAAAPDSNRLGYLVKVPLPIDSKVSSSIRQTLLRLAEKSPPGVKAENFPIVVLEFETSAEKSGRGSELESCIALARYLGHSDLSRIRTVAYLPAPTGFDADQESKSILNGHAVLVAIAANELALEPGTSIGEAGIDDKQVEPWVREVYRSVASKRLRTVPPEIALAMLDPKESLFRVTTADRENVYVDGKERTKLENAGSLDTKTISSPGSLAVLTRAQMEEFGLIQLTPSSRTDLARQLDLEPHSLDGNPAEGKNWKAIQVNLPTFIDEKSAQWLVKAVDREVSRNDVNMIIFNIDANVGDVDACLRIAQRLVEFDQDEVRTVAFLRGSANGPVGMLALACSHLIMAPDTKLGGKSAAGEDVGSTPEGISEEDLEKLKPLIQALAEKKQSDWSLMMSMLNPNLTLSRYRQDSSGQIRILGDEEFLALEDKKDWALQGLIGGIGGINALTAEKNFIARTIAEDMGQIKTFYQLGESPKSVQPTATDRWVERFASFLSSPFVAPWLLFAAMFFFSTEMSAPGLGLPGFLATVCFVLFFWSQSLGGNADWLEIILFIVGAVFIMIEIFALPGFGIFGIGGLLMMIVAVVLASQSFLIPRTNEELEQIPYSLLPVIGAGFGVIAGAIALRNVLPNSPYLRRMMLEPRQRVDTGLEGQGDPESMVDWSHLAGETGVTVTKLYPSGKVRISGRVYDVISSGQLVDKGETVIVIEAQGNRIVVKQVD